MLWARTNFLTATRLDPDYLNAWVKLQEAGEQILMPAKERDAITFNLLRLDPLQRHTRHSFERVSDLAGLWNAVSAAATHQLTTSTNLLALPASKLALEKKAKTPGEYYSHYSRYSRSDWELAPAQAVSMTPFVNLAGQMIFDGGRMEE